MTSPDFWTAVDSQASWGGPRRPATCTCWSRSDTHHLDVCDLANDWSTQRDDRGMGGCLALKSDGRRCGERVADTFPFCARYHLEGALRAFIDHLAALGVDNINYGHFDPDARAIAALVHRGMYGHLSEPSKRQLAGHLGIKLLRAENAPPTPTPSIENRVRRCALYRHYDGEGSLLYVGISVDPEARVKQHQATSPWWEFVATSDVDWHLTEVDAAAAERRAIHEEAPIFNKAGATAERDARAIQYLIAHEAYGLLRTAA